MKLHKCFKIEKACAPAKSMRPVLENAYLDVENKRVLATDSFKLIVLPVDVGPDDTSGYLSVEAIKASRKTEQIEANVSLKTNGISYQRPNPGEYPRSLMDIMDKSPKPDEKECISFSLDAKLLYDLASAMGDTRIILDIDSTDQLRAISVRPLHSQHEGPTGLLMQCYNPTRKVRT